MANRDLGTETDRLTERARAVVAEFDETGRRRTVALEEMVALVRQVVEENDALRSEVEAARQSEDEVVRRLEMVTKETDELAAHHDRLSRSYALFLETISARMRTLPEEEDRIRAARDIAFTRARFGLGGEDEAVQEAPPATGREGGGDPTPALSGQVVRQLEDAMKGFRNGGAIT